MKITLEVIVGDEYDINLPKHDRHGQTVTVFHDSATLDGREIVRTHCIVEDDTGHRFVIRKMRLDKHYSKEEAALLYEHGFFEAADDDNHIGSGDSSIHNHE